MPWPALLSWLVLVMDCVDVTACADGSSASMARTRYHGLRWSWPALISWLVPMQLPVPVPWPGTDATARVAVMACVDVMAGAAAMARTDGISLRQCHIPRQFHGPH